MIGGGRTGQAVARQASTARRRFVVALTASLLISSGLVWQATRAAFTGATGSAGNAFTTGSVTLSDDDTGTGLFTVGNLKPGDSQMRCITVSYAGSRPALVTLAAASSSGDLRPHLTWSVVEGTGGRYGSCTGFRAESVDYAGTIAHFAATATTFDSGVGMFAPGGPGVSRTYQLTFALDPAAPNSAQGQSAALELRWEARTRTHVPATAFGWNGEAQLGLGDTTNRLVPTAIGSIADWSSISSGARHSCGLRAGGTAWCWGRNTGGQLGDGTTTDRTMPTQVGTDTDWLSVSVGHEHTCGVRTDHTLWCWGSGWGGELGLGDWNDRLTPTQVGTATNWAHVSLGEAFSCATQVDGSLWCWGWGGRLGTGDNTFYGTPTRIGLDGEWRDVRTGWEHACAIRTDGTLWCWGRNDGGQLGLGDTSARLSPTRVGTDSNWADVAFGYGHTCATRSDGTLWCWGDNSWGLGFGGTTQEDNPTQLGTDTTWAGVTAGGNHTCAVRTDHTLWCWGRNDSGQLGDGTTSYRFTPVLAATGVRFASATNAAHTLTLGRPNP